ncbi:MAG: hypothetical protein M3405_16065 [Acidobacteriota bacterium]|jgi:5-hydroxyisourate hydrolase-like protein (transthyretin family)|nr:hypothetical protein [Acidobacteriota bacterium]
MISRRLNFEYKIDIKNLFFCVGLLVFAIITFSSYSFAQSIDQNAPTPLTTDEISGQIKARDIGDSRLTTYYFVFNGDRGDVFINVVTRNLNGDIDIFTAKTLQPRTKISVYANNSVTETGRVVYMRQPEKLILRVQGRTPNDDPATFQIKFAGSFQALSGGNPADTEILPEVKIEREGTVKVNSVGTIIEEPKTGEEGKIAETLEVDKTKIPGTFDPTKKPDSILPEINSILNPRDIATETTESKDDATSDDSATDITVNIEKQPKNTSTIVKIERSEENEDLEAAEEAKRLSKISLKLKLKNGDKFERAMNEVLSINVIKTVLTIVTSDGKIHEFSIFEVNKMIIE